jgi:hypothetical protein
MTNPHPKTSPQDPLPRHKPKQNKPRRTTQQQIPTITAADPNLWIGNTLTIPKPPQTLRIYCQNIRGAKHRNDPWDDWTQGHNTLSEWAIDIATLTETNTKWNHSNITTANKIAKS